MFICWRRVLLEKCHITEVLLLECGLMVEKCNDVYKKCFYGRGSFVRKIFDV